MGTEEDCEIHIKSICLLVRKCMINEQVKTAQKKALMISPIKYPIKSTRLFVFKIDDKTIGRSEIFSLGSYIPNKVIIGILENENYNGSFKTNPFQFESHDIKKLNLCIDGYNNEININNNKDDSIEGYHSLCESLNFYGSDKSSITHEEYKNGNYLFAFNLNPDKGCSGQFNPIRTGTIELSLELKDSSEKKLRVIVFCEYDNQLTIDSKSEVEFAHNI